MNRRAMNCHKNISLKENKIVSGDRKVKEELKEDPRPKWNSPNALRKLTPVSPRRDLMKLQTIPGKDSTRQRLAIRVRPMTSMTADTKSSRGGSTCSSVSKPAASKPAARMALGPAVFRNTLLPPLRRTKPGAEKGPSDTTANGKQGRPATARVDSKGWLRSQQKTALEHLGKSKTLKISATPSLMEEDSGIGASLTYSNEDSSKADPCIAATDILEDPPQTPSTEDCTKLENENSTIFPSELIENSHGEIIYKKLMKTTYSEEDSLSKCLPVDTSAQSTNVFDTPSIKTTFNFDTIPDQFTQTSTNQSDICPIKTVFKFNTLLDQTPQSTNQSDPTETGLNFDIVADHSIQMSTNMSDICPFNFDTISDQCTQLSINQSNPTETTLNFDTCPNQSMQLTNQADATITALNVDTISAHAMHSLKSESDVCPIKFTFDFDMFPNQSTQCSTFTSDPAQTTFNLDITPDISIQSSTNESDFSVKTGYNFDTSPEKSTESSNQFDPEESTRNLGIINNYSEQTSINQSDICLSKTTPAFDTISNECTQLSTNQFDICHTESIFNFDMTSYQSKQLLPIQANNCSIETISNFDITSNELPRNITDQSTVVETVSSHDIISECVHKQKVQEENHSRNLLSLSLEDLDKYSNDCFKIGEIKREDRMDLAYNESGIFSEDIFENDREFLVNENQFLVGVMERDVGESGSGEEMSQFRDLGKGEDGSRVHMEFGKVDEGTGEEENRSLLIIKDVEEDVGEVEWKEEEEEREERGCWWDSKTETDEVSLEEGDEGIDCEWAGDWRMMVVKGQEVQERRGDWAQTERWLLQLGRELDRCEDRAALLAREVRRFEARPWAQRRPPAVSGDSDLDFFSVSSADSEEELPSPPSRISLPSQGSYLSFGKGRRTTQKQTKNKLFSYLTRIFKRSDPNN